MAIETATTADGEIMARIHAAAFPPSDAWSSNVFHLQLVLPNVYALLDSDGGLILLRVAADEAEILTLAVDPARRRRGIATRLLQSAIETLRDLGIHSLFLEVSVVNRAARALYARLGFQAVGIRARYYADDTDALVLRLALSASTAEA